MSSISCSYEMIVDGYDWGPSVSRIILKHDLFRKLDNVACEQFQVFFKKQHVWHEALISAADLIGNEVHLRFKQHPEFRYLSPITYDHKTNRNIFTEPLEVKVNLLHPLLINEDRIDMISLSKKEEYFIPQLELFKKTEYHFNGHVKLNYLLYLPLGEKDLPLIVWLHGAGEGGTDERIAFLGNPVSRLVEPVIQDKFSKAAVLFPQAPTFWMDDGTGTYTKNGNSMYTKALHGLIDNVIRHENSIDKHRVYIGGCSNGGYMTVNLLKHYPEMFAAAFPVCEAFRDKWLSDDDIAILSNKPIWFVQAKNDTVVVPESFVIPTFERLQRMKAKELHLTLLDSVADWSSSYFDKDDKPYEYHGHFSWIHALNDRCMLEDESLFSWLSKHST
ncbi:MAG: prolyl oligopeptidase family serine peptidase [Bacilli bacterium]|nr:prolyl oligopeptidase family serine peptidase [Bacilli bacterium]